MKGRLFIALAMMVLVGCGGGGGGDSTPASTGPEDIKGTYALTGFTVAYANGTTVTEKSPGVISWSGTMEIGPTVIKQTITLNGMVFNETWTYVVEWITNQSGVIHANTNSVKFTMVNGNLTTDMKDVDFEEWDYWKKISSSYSVKSVETQDAETKEEGAYIWMGKLLK